MEKVIHYCWFGPKPLSKLAKRCIKSWEKYLPDYKIVRWSEENVDLNECDFIKEAYEQKKWAYVADYARSKALYEQGGFYFDTDMELVGPVDFIIDKELVVGLEDGGLANAAMVYVKKKKSKYMKELLEIYQNMKFNPTGDLFDICIPKILKQLFANYGGYQEHSKEIQQIDNGKIWIYPRDYFYPISYDHQNNTFTDNTCMIHHFDATWVDTGEKISIFLRRHKLGFLTKFIWSIMWFCKRIKAFFLLLFNKLHLKKLTEKEKQAQSDILWTSKLWRFLHRKK